MILKTYFLPVETLFSKRLFSVKTMPEEFKTQQSPVILGFYTAALI